jgi:formylmethanofuran dehydrogenase subunit B
MIGDWEYQLENITIWFQGGVRKWVFISLAIMLVSCIPLYFIVSGINSVIFNTFSYNQDVNFKKKEIPEKPIEYSATKILNLKNGSKDLYMIIDNKLNAEIGYYPIPKNS